MKIKEKKIGVVGLGYVGLPLAIEFGKSDFEVVGFDVNESRVAELCQSIDNTLRLHQRS